MMHILKAHNVATARDGDDELYVIPAPGSLPPNTVLRFPEPRNDDFIVMRGRSPLGKPFYVGPKSISVRRHTFV
jgi:hypothetical protein